MKITGAVPTDGLHMWVQGWSLGVTLRRLRALGEKLFSVHVLDDTPPEDSIPLVFPELDQHLQVRISLRSFSQCHKIQ
jgi:hypothetical protein